MLKPSVMKARWLTAIILIALFGCQRPVDPPVTTDFSGYNLLMISLDTLRQDRLGLYGCPDPVSPFMDTLSRHAVVFTDMFAQSPSTVRSHRAIFTSKYVFDQDAPFPSADETLAGILTRKGLTTAGFVDGGLMHRKFGNHEGFQTYDDDGGAGFKTIYPKAVDWLKSHGATPFFLFLHTYDIHFPYTPPAPYDTMFMPDETAWFHLGAEHGHDYFNQIELKPSDYRFIDGRYNGGVRYSDSVIEDLFADLRGMDLLDRTVVAIVSDHGESLGERRYVGHNQLYNVQLQVPCLLFLPPELARLVPEPMETVDLMPTLLNLFSLVIPEGLQGISADADIFGRGVSRGRRLRLSEAGDRMIHAPDGWKLILRKLPENDELYQAGTDPEEMENLLITRSGQSKALQEGLEKFIGEPVENLRSARSNTMINIPLMQPGGKDAELMEQLKNLGYVD